jgi:AcrR family transcriptional regulator
MPITAQTGRKLGPRALKTRQSLLDSAAALLVERSLLDISVVEIARKSGTSPATFYHYFKDVEEAVLQLAEQAAEEMPSVVELMAGSWVGDEGLDKARAVVSAFIEHWDAHHAVLLVRNLAADNGDSRFQRVRRSALSPVLDQLADQLKAAQARGAVSAEIHPYIASAALVAILERLSAHYRSLHHFGASRDELIETCARVLHQVISGAAGN